MSIKHENINYYSSPLPFKIFTFHAKNLDRVIQPHWHRSTEILFCIEGKLKITFPKKAYILKENQFAVINPVQIHSTQSLSHNWVLCIQLPFSFMNNISKNTFMEKFIFNTEKCIFDPGNSKVINQLFKQLIKNYNSNENSILKDIDISCNVCQIIKNLIDKNATIISNKYSGSNIAFTEKIINFIDKNCQHDLTLDDVANFCSYSSSYTSRIIKEILGTSFYNFLNSIRLTKVITIIKNSKKNELNLIEVAEKSGFKNYRNFYNSFKKTYHISPGKFRNNFS